VLFSSRVRVRVRVRITFSVWLVSGYAHVLILLSVVIVLYPYSAGTFMQLIVDNKAETTEKGVLPVIIS